MPSKRQRREGYDEEEEDGRGASCCCAATAGATGRGVFATGGVGVGSLCSNGVCIPQRWVCKCFHTRGAMLACSREMDAARRPWDTSVRHQHLRNV